MKTICFSQILVLVLLLSASTFALVVPSIHSIDFANFTFPGDPIFGDKKFRLSNGEFVGDEDREPISLLHVGYGDVTGDGTEEAIVSLLINVKGGTARPHISYVYSLVRGKPRLLWSFNTGDRADGGLRRVYMEDGKLVVERYSLEGSKGDCCPIAFERTCYRWSGKRFRRSGAVEKLLHPEGHGFPVMSLYRSSK